MFIMSGVINNKQIGSSKSCINLRNDTSISYKLLMYLGTHENTLFQTYVSRDLGIPLTTLNYHITKFKREGLITTTNNIINLTDKGIKAFKYIWDNSDKTTLRAHNIQVKFNVVKCRKFNDYISIYEPMTNGKYRGFKTKLRGFTCMFYSPTKLICVLPDVYGDTEEEICSAVQLMIKDLRYIIETTFDVKLGAVEVARIQKMHIAVLNSEIAKIVALRGFTEENSEYSVDMSHGIPEVEITNPNNALRDIMELVKLDKEVKNGGDI